MITKACFWIFDLIFWWWWDGNLISQLKTWALTRLWHDIILKRSQTIRAIILHFWSFMLKIADYSLFVCLLAFSGVWSLWLSCMFKWRISQLKMLLLTRLWQDIIMKRNQTICATILKFWSFINSLEILNCLLFVWSRVWA